MNMFSDSESVLVLFIEVILRADEFTGFLFVYRLMVLEGIKALFWALDTFPDYYVGESILFVFSYFLTFLPIGNYRKSVDLDDELYRFFLSVKL